MSLQLLLSALWLLASSTPGRCAGKVAVAPDALRCYGNLSYLAAGSSTRRQLSNGQVVHFQPDGSSVPREEVVAATRAAMEGEKNFHLEAPVNGSTEFFDLTRNDMMLFDKDHDFSQAFEVDNAFVVEQPDVRYKVACPAESEGTSCYVTKTTDELDSSVDCFSEEASSALPEDLLAKCSDQVYDVNLLSKDAHFFLLAVNRDNSGKSRCPPNVALDSVQGSKHKAVVYSDGLMNVPSIRLGSSTLRGILDAEEQAEPLDEPDYDIMTNNCIHYAGRISRPLGFPETEELASFLTENIVGSPSFERVLGRHADSGGRRALMALAAGGKNMLKYYIEGMVNSQLELVED